MRKFIKPKVLSDIRISGQTVYSSTPTRINLSYRRVLSVSTTNFFKWCIVVASSWFLILGSATAPTTTTLAANPSTSSAAQTRAELEAQLKDLERQIDQYEDQIVSYQKQGSTLKNEVSTLNSKIAKLNLQLKAVNLTLSELDNKIVDTEERIDATEESIENKKILLAQILNNVYQSDRSSLMEIFLKNPRISDFFSDVNSMTLLQGSVRTTIKEITDLRDELKDQREQFALAKADAETIRKYQVAQKNQTDQLKAQKNQLIAVTKNEESKYQNLLKETQKTAAQIRSQIFTLLGGGELTFERAYQLAKYASDATGVRPALILAVLDRESALGQNVGRCRYNQINSTTGLPTMSPKRDVPAFLEITKALDIDPESVMVSCAIPRDGSYGGAMGPAQFIPSTWKIYAPRISALTGRPSNPWSNEDAFLGTALYLKDAGAANTSLAKEREAAARYYAGSNWSRFLWTYGEAVVSRANRFEADIAVMNG